VGLEGWLSFGPEPILETLNSVRSSLDDQGSDRRASTHSGQHEQSGNGARHPGQVRRDRSDSSTGFLKFARFAKRTLGNLSGLKSTDDRLAAAAIDLA